MRKRFTCIAGLCVLAVAFSCQSKKQDQSAAKPLLLENRTVQQQIGTDCDKLPDARRTDCAIIDFSVPALQGTGAQSSVGQAVAAWADKFLIRLLTWTDYNTQGKGPQTVDAAIQRFQAIHDENAGSVASGKFKTTCSSSELLNDGKHLTLMLDGFSFQGGNRALEEVAIATFDVKTGKQLTLDDLVKDKAALLPVLEDKVRDTRADAFQAGFDFDRQEPLALPTSYGLAPDGLVCHYQPDEIYRLGGATEFTVPYSELAANLNVAVPAPPARDTSAATAIYEVRGNELVIPPFEIEVHSSKTVDRTLAKKKETIIVSAMFWGVPLDPKEKAKGEDGMVSVLKKDIELTGSNRLARFEGLRFSKNLLDKMEDKDISLLINVFSGRRSSQDNLLDCGIVDMKASQFADKRFVLGCNLIDETAKHKAVTSGFPEACYALPEAGAQQPLRFVVDCSERGDMQFAGQPMKTYEDLMAALRPVLVGMLKAGRKAADLPGIETKGCLMGSSGAIRDYYDELKAELTGKGKSTATKNAGQKLATAKTGNTARTAPTTKPASAGTGTPTVTLKQNGDILVNGKAVSDLERLRKVLQEALLKQTVLPDKIQLKTVGQTGMGMRAEINTIIAESIAGAKWVRKKNAILTLNNAVGKKLAAATQLELDSYQTSGKFAYISARPRQADGRAIDYSRTTYAAELALGKFVDNTVGLLQYEKGAWKIVTYSIGVSKPPVDVWVKKFKVPKALF